MKKDNHPEANFLITLSSAINVLDGKNDSKSQRLEA
jgi:hypothetical protein